MSTKKLLAREVVVRYPHPQNKYYLIVDYPKCYFLAEDGTKYRFDFNRELKAGDKAIIVKDSILQIIQCIGSMKYTP